MTTKDEALKQALDALGRVAGDDLQRWKKSQTPAASHGMYLEQSPPAAKHWSRRMSRS